MTLSLGAGQPPEDTEPASTHLCRYTDPPCEHVWPTQSGKQHHLKKAEGSEEESFLIRTLLGSCYIVGGDVEFKIMCMAC